MNRFRHWTIALALILISVGVAAETFTGEYYRKYLRAGAPSSTQQFFASALRGGGVGIRASRGVIMQSVATFVDSNGRPIANARLKLEYRRTADGMMTCVVHLPANTCYEFGLDPEHVWRLANFVALGKRRALTLLDPLGGDAETKVVVLSDGMVPTFGRTADPDEYVAATLATDELIGLFQHIDYDESFVDDGFDDAALVDAMRRELGTPTTDIGPADRILDRTYTNSDLHSRFVAKLGHPIRFTGLPYRYGWVAVQGEEHVRPLWVERAVDPDQSDEALTRALAWAVGLARIDESVLPVDVRQLADADEAAVRVQMDEVRSAIAEARGDFPTTAEWQQVVRDGLSRTIDRVRNLQYQARRHAQAVELFRVTAALRTFAYRTPDQFIDYLTRLAGHQKLLR